MRFAVGQVPPAVLLIALRPGRTSSAGAGDTATTVAGLRRVLEVLGPVYDVPPCVTALILPPLAPGKAARIAEAICEAVDRRSAANPRSPVHVAAGVAALHDDEDPADVVCRAEERLSLAERSALRVVAESRFATTGLD